MADPLIAVVGSVDLSRPGLKKPEHAQQAVLEVGRALAEGGCRILVYSSDEQFVDRGVVAGYIAALSGRSAPLEERIVVLYPADDGEPQFPEQISNRALLASALIEIPAGMRPSIGL